jgi:hypothetical protein
LLPARHARSVLPTCIRFVVSHGSILTLECLGNAAPPEWFRVPPAYLPARWVSRINRLKNQFAVDPHKGYPAARPQ